MYFRRKCVCLLRPGGELVYQVLKAFCLGLVEVNVRYFLAVLNRKLTFRSFQVGFIVKMGDLKNGLGIALNGLQL